MMSPDMAAYILAPGVGYYLQSDIVNCITYIMGTSDSVQRLTETVAKNIPLCLKQWYRRLGSLLCGKWFEIGSWGSELDKGTPVSY